MIITNLGNYIYLPVYQVPECKWKDLGKHVSNIVLTAPEEQVINAFIYNKETKNNPIVTFTKGGMIKKTVFDSYNVNRFNKTYTAIKLKDNDEVVNATYANTKNVIITKNGYYLTFDDSLVPEAGTKASGVKGISLKDDEVVFGSALSVDDDYIMLLTNKNTAKRIKTQDLVNLGRAKRGNTLIKKTKTTTYYITSAVITDSKDSINIVKDDEVKTIKSSDVAIMDLASTGSNIKEKGNKLIKVAELEEAQAVELPKMKEEVIAIQESFIEDFKL